MKKKSKHKVAKAMEYSFYMSVYTYIHMEYKAKYAKLFADSPISDKIVDLVTQYYWGGNTVPYTAFQIVDLLKSKYT